MQSLRNAVRSLLGRRVFSRRLPERFGGSPIYVAASADLRLVRGDLEAMDPMLFEFVEEWVKSGDVVWDVGANVGLFAFSSAFRAGPAGRVFALEPDNFHFQLLTDSTARMPEQSAPVTLLNMAVSDRNDLEEFCIVRRGGAKNHLVRAEGAGSDQTGGVAHTRLVSTVSLDWLLDRLPAPTVLKIDIEGGEAFALKGAQTVLSKVRPVLLCEVFPRNVDAVTRILQEHRYTMLNAEEPTGQRKPQSSACLNTIAVPAEKHGLIARGA